MAELSNSFCLSHHCHWPGPRSLAATDGVSVDVLSYGYLDVSVPRVPFLPLCIQSKIPLSDTWKSIKPEGNAVKRLEPFGSIEFPSI